MATYIGEVCRAANNLTLSKIRFNFFLGNSTYSSQRQLTETMLLKHMKHLTKR